MKIKPTSTIAPPPGCADAVQRILAAAEQLFAEQGYDTVSTSAIAERAGVSKANIFHHFSSKHSLYLEVLRTGCKESAHLLDDMTQNNGGLTERLGHFIHAHIDNLLEHDAHSRLILREILENGPSRGQELAEQVLGNNFSRLVGILRDSQCRGELRRNVDPAIIATLLVGANVFFFQSRGVLRHFPDVSFADNPRAYGRMLTDVLLHGVLSDTCHASVDMPKRKALTKR